MANLRIYEKLAKICENGNIYVFVSPKPHINANFVLYTQVWKKIDTTDVMA